MDTLPQPALTTDKRRGIGEYLMEEVDGMQSTWQLTAYCFMTGWMCVEISMVMTAQMCTVLMSHFQRRDLVLCRVRMVRVPNR